MAAGRAAGRPEEDPFLAHLRDLLRDWGPVLARRMFGGVGLYREGVMFGIVHGDTLYLKVDEANRADYERAGAAPFRYERRGRMVALSYWTAPAGLLDDGETLADWAERAWAAARRAVLARR